jgi:NitT/TauT family transport system substrate-binding protein
MEDQKLIEKHATAVGLGDITVDFNQFRSSDVMNDALLSGSVDFVSLGIPAIITIWSKTKGTPLAVRASTGLNVSPLLAFLTFGRRDGMARRVLVQRTEPWLG